MGARVWVQGVIEGVQLLCPPWIVSFSFFGLKFLNWNFPGGPVVKNLPADARDKGSNLGLGRFHVPRGN